LLVIDQPWYHQGLRFQCTGCGDCCTGAPGFVWVNKAEVQALAASAGLDAAQFEKKYVRQVGIRKSLIEMPNGDCIFFNARKRHCDVYDIRPRQCRTWPYWESNVSTPEAWQRTCQSCPGAGTGPLLSREEIQQSIAKFRV
jgi:Fe-S-cluster containining protein